MVRLLSSPLGGKPHSYGGTHCILELYDCPGELLDNAEAIAKTLREAAKVARSKVLNEVLHEFDPQGVTALLLLAESHISIHTWPESGYAAVDVFTCGENTKPKEACHFLAKTLQASDYSLQVISRGIPGKDTCLNRIA
ncbi:adenosylmethionine decarboxylase [Phormidium sp. CCY1219]|uniref:adenosylmethionine decarboxylase n=1 Tax=Phormidium sp. CCY1219 TaxID=2886104 RepID=UPI002D1F1146|nr:adenosylmethionine decarboxylase [Phormidium sp. CCY1219]MEB3830316.1 adenosylmethionine decarboxylase [Phormidium sp. CCY1219]